MFGAVDSIDAYALLSVPRQDFDCRKDQEESVRWNTQQCRMVASFKTKNDGYVLIQSESSFLSVPVQDLVIHDDDDLLTALVQVYNELKTFDFRSIPEQDDNFTARLPLT